jgi:uncharacterized membrane protein YozB (DUF420 family)
VTSTSDEATAHRVIAALSVFVVVAVAVVLSVVPRRALPAGSGPDPLATLNATLNGGSALGLSLGFFAIKRRRIALHRACMLTSFALSSVFLVTYLIHHARVGSVPYGGHGVLRAVYFALLVPHVLLAAAVVPLALVTLRRGWIRDVARHRYIARRTLPIWLYVSVSGVLLYLMLYY